MLGIVIIPISRLVERYDIDLGVVLHLGAHLGEEADEYQCAHATEVIWVEADPAIFERLAAAVRPYGHRAVQAVISDRDDAAATFFLTSNDGKSSSLFPMKTHVKEHPDVVVTGTTRLRTTAVDTLCAGHGISTVDLLTMDLQGAELLALRGATRTLESVQYVYTEVNVAELYEGGAMLEEMDAHLADFVRQETALTPHGWGDAFYIRADRVPPGTDPRTWMA